VPTSSTGGVSCFPAPGRWESFSTRGASSTPLLREHLQLRGNDGELSQSICHAGYSAGSTRMSKQKLLRRLVASLATNHGVQPKQTEIWQRLKSLTPREVDVLCYVLGGQLNKQIAAELGIGEKTIKVHRGHVMEKLGVQSSGQLLAMVLTRR
jgi:DNA-binding NarL/FixJ family response regulator